MRPAPISAYWVAVVRGGVAQDQVNAVGDKPFTMVAQLAKSPEAFCSSNFTLPSPSSTSVLEALGRSVQRFVLNQLADADIADLAVGGSNAVRGALCGFGMEAASAVDARNDKTKLECF